MPPDQATHRPDDRNALAILSLLGAGGAAYAVLAALANLALSGLAAQLPPDGPWRLLLYWLLFMLPVLPAAWFSVAATCRLVRPFNRDFAFYLVSGLLIAGTGLWVLILLFAAGPLRGTGLGLLALATAYLTWRVLRRGLVRRPG